MYRKESLTFLVLEALHELYDDHQDWVYPYDHIANQIRGNVPISQIRKSMKILRDNGHARYSVAHSEDDNLVCGSGHQLTLKGLAVYEAIKAQP